MMILRLCSLFGIFLLSHNSHVFSQQLSYTDPAISYQRILLEKSGQGGYQLIGNYKVQGTSFLYGGNQKGSVYTKKEKAEMATISYNTYNQQLSVQQSGEAEAINMALKDVDSFRLLVTTDKGYTDAFRFVNASQMDGGKKFFVQIICETNRFIMYKSYVSVLGYVSTNYVQSELRQFDLVVEYYYAEKGQPGLKKIKPSGKSVKTEFGKYGDLSEIIQQQDFDKNPENGFCQVLQQIK